jgi:L-ascorbate metabolism protein UlaG (beta-lactamase superfamily)
MLCSAFVLLVGFVWAAYWLGWGRDTTWGAATGWDQLPDPERQFCERSIAAFSADDAAPTLTWLGHATVLVEWQGQRCVVDPVAAGRVKVAPRWFDSPILDLSATYDLILLTHAHMDHLDMATLEALPRTRIVLPAGSERFLSEAVKRKHRIEPMALGAHVTLGDLDVVSVAAAHGGWRYPWQRGVFACGYVFRAEGEALYVAGDTAMGAHFKQIADAYHPRIAVLPIGAYAPQWFLQCRHLNPEEALDAAEQLGVEFVMPYHFGTYRLSLEPMAEPLQRFSAEALKRDQAWILL